MSLFHTDWLAVLVVGLFLAIPTVGVWLVVRRDPAVPPLKRRPSDPQRGAANRTGGERGDLLAGSVAALPRSPMAPAAGDPRPPAAGARLPVATVDAPHAVATGHQPRRVWVHG
jgi:hypothetical protein